MIGKESYGEALHERQLDRHHTHRSLAGDCRGADVAVRVYCPSVGIGPAERSTEEVWAEAETITKVCCQDVSVLC